jgi:Domain of unknown function (DUF4352)
VTEREKPKLSTEPILLTPPPGQPEQEQPQWPSQLEHPPTTGRSTWAPLVWCLFFWPAGFVMSIWRLAKHYGRGREITALVVSSIQLLVVLVLIIAAASGASGGGSNTPVPLGTAVPFTFGGTTVSLTVEKIVAPATGSYGTPNPGNEYVGVRVTAQNTSSTNATVDLTDITTLVDTSGTSYTSNGQPLSDCPMMGSYGLATIAPGASATGCVPFEVPSGTTFSHVSIGSNDKTPGIWSVS